MSAVNQKCFFVILLFLVLGPRSFCDEPNMPKIVVVPVPFNLAAFQQELKTALDPYLVTMVPSKELVIEGGQWNQQNNAQRWANQLNQVNFQQVSLNLAAGTSLLASAPVQRDLLGKALGSQLGNLDWESVVRMAPDSSTSLFQFRIALAKAAVNINHYGWSNIGIGHYGPRNYGTQTILQGWRAKPGVYVSEGIAREVATSLNSSGSTFAQELGHLQSCAKTLGSISKID